MLLAKEQRIGAAILCGIGLVAWLIVAIWPSFNPSPVPQEPEPVKSSKKSWAERKDSIRLADSMRYVQWAAEREQRYDSFRMVDSLRRVEWKKERLKWRDSARVADSIWLDSVGIAFVRRVKKDTILDLNHCDTSELMFIRGIGRYTAVQIVQYRERLGGYYSPSQLTDDVFSKLSLDTLLGHFTADTTAIRHLRINTCSVEQLNRHPYLRYEQAKAIYDLRRKRIRIRSLEELRSLPQLNDEDLKRLAAYITLE